MSEHSVTLQIEGMHCQACVNRLQIALRRVEGVEVQGVEVGQAQLAYDPAQVSLREIEAAIDNAGFEVRAEA